MTCIVGLVDDGCVYMGGDSAGVSGWDLALRADSKVFSVGAMLFGFTTSFRMGQLLRHGFALPTQECQDDYEYLCTSFIDAVRERLKQGGFSNIKDGVERAELF